MHPTNQSEKPENKSGTFTFVSESVTKKVTTLGLVHTPGFLDRFVPRISRHAPDIGMTPKIIP